MAWFIRTMSSATSLPMREPTLSLGTVVSLSTIKLLVPRRPFSALGSTRMRKSGASAGLVVRMQIVIERVLSNSSSCTMTAGLGLPA